jgi:hypothetical protein
MLGDAGNLLSMVGHGILGLKLTRTLHTFYSIFRILIITLVTIILLEAVTGVNLSFGEDESVSSISPSFGSCKSFRISSVCCSIPCFTAKSPPVPLLWLPVPVKLGASARAVP